MKILANTGEIIQNLTDWDITQFYHVGDRVINNGNIYTANADIPKNTAFTVGTTGATWTRTFKGAGNPSGATVTQIACGMKTMLLLYSDGTVWGAQDKADNTTPYTQPGLPAWYANATGTSSGFSNASRIDFTDRLGSPSTSGIKETGKATWIGIQGGTAYVLFDNGNLWGWGYNGQGQLATTNTTYIGMPRRIHTACAKVFVHKSGHGRGDQAYHRTVIQGTDGKIYAAGYNGEGQMGINTGATANVTTWTELPWCGTNPHSLWNLGGWIGGIICVKQVSPDDPKYQWWACEANGTQATLVSTAQKGTKAAYNVTSYWLSGTNTSFTINDVGYSGGYDAADNSVSAIIWHSGGIKTAGSNISGAIGPGSTGFTNYTPYAVSGLTGTIKQISHAGGGEASYCLALMTDGTLYGWGRNLEYQLTSSGVNIGTPTVIATNVKEILFPHERNYYQAYYNSVYFRKNDGTYWASGWNAFGALGNGTTSNPASSLPGFPFTRIMIKKSVEWVVCGLIHASNGQNQVIPVLIDSFGNWWAWGINTYHFFHKQTTGTFTIPTRVNPTYL